MTALFKKLNFKEQKMALVLNAPSEFASHLEDLEQLTLIDTNVRETVNYDFLIVFVYSNEDINTFAQQLDAHLVSDATLWYAYIKKSSKKYKSDIARDTEGWHLLGERGYEGVRQVAIDADWSALRFRHVDFIKSMKRSNSMAISAKGKERTKNGG